MTTITTTVLKPHLGPDGRIVQIGETIEVEEQRFKALANKGYVPRLDGGEAAPAQAERSPGVLTNANSRPRRQAITAPVPPQEQKAPPAKGGKGPKTVVSKGK